MNMDRTGTELLKCVMAIIIIIIIRRPLRTKLCITDYRSDKKTTATFPSAV